MRLNLFLSLLLATAALAGDGHRRSTHPHFDDHGTLSWFTKLAKAKSAAKKQKKLVLVVFGREQSSRSRELVERVITTETISDRLSDLAVGLAADWDRPEDAIAELMKNRFPGATNMPFVALITHDGKWIDGYAGSKTAAEFLAVIEKAEKLPSLQTPNSVRRRLKRLLKKTEAAAKDDNWKLVLESSVQALATKGLCPERKRFRDLVQQGRAWAAAQFDEVIRLAREMNDIDSGISILSGVKRQFEGQPEGHDAVIGLIALKRLELIPKMYKRQPHLRNQLKTAEIEYRGTPWAALFKEKPEK